ncbi:putative chromatin regulator PHD family [Helianthus annuus]|uniref:Chromatin regulator PHD family n=1 Tax=Helianthus annuus TaxID=4232 RepID=A0A9K3H834_HELAN|nr:putative chromatin regulator PHD family [Helianthus annuus]KAJ0470313.1 putative chromatin regulator PHD family [Helianthus annuus]KAJ0841785.1 putative chromatin regulator PHD family [Helianthus annuus]
MVITIIFCSFIFLTFRIKTELINLLKDSFVYIFRYDSEYIHHHEPAVNQVDLPTILFHDLQERRRREVDETCFICFASYDSDDVVCALSRCGHVFHSECVGRLIHRKQSQCPFCWSSFFSGRSSFPTKIFG